MYIKKTTGYVISLQNGTISPHEKSVDDRCRIVKCGRVLTLKEEAQSYHHKSVTIDSITNQRFHYYQVISSPGACETCEEHNGAIYPVAEGKEGENLPPFHPNCKCEIQGFDTKNPSYDPWHKEVVVWLDMMYGGGTIEQKAQKLIDFYQWTEFSQQEIIHFLSGTERITHVGKRISAFFEMLENGFETKTIESWLNLCHSPTVYGPGRVVEMPEIEGFNRANWYAFEGLKDINRYAKHMIGEENVQVVIGTQGEVIDDTGRYWVAVGPNVMNPDHLPTEAISLEEMHYGTKLDVVLKDEEGNRWHSPNGLCISKQSRSSSISQS